MSLKISVRVLEATSGFARRRAWQAEQPAPQAPFCRTRQVSHCFLFGSDRNLDFHFCWQRRNLHSGHCFPRQAGPSSSCVNLGFAFLTTADFSEGCFVVLTADSGTCRMGRRRGVSVGGESHMCRKSIADPRRSPYKTRSCRKMLQYNAKATPQPNADPTKCRPNQMFDARAPYDPWIDADPGKCLMPIAHGL
jgi:hypothetical protein